MERRAPHSRESYQVKCYHCGHDFDAIDSTWCSCLVSPRSLVCPHCLNCFCKAPQEYKNRFWSSAPQSLWKEKLSSYPEDANFKPTAVPRAEELAHPLILVVEDEPGVRKMAAIAIQNLGYNVITAANGIQGLELARNCLPDLVITDALLPKLDGREMARRLKDADETRHIKVVVMTSIYRSAKYRMEAMKVFHVDEYLLKPLEFKQLQTVLMKYIE